jgi:hypothetical protein
VTYRVEVTVVASLGEEFGYQLDVAHLRGVVQRAGDGWGQRGTRGDLARCVRRATIRATAVKTSLRRSVVEYRGKKHSQCADVIVVVAPEHHPRET